MNVTLREVLKAYRTLNKSCIQGHWKFSDHCFCPLAALAALKDPSILQADADDVDFTMISKALFKYNPSYLWGFGQGFDGVPYIDQDHGSKAFKQGWQQGLKIFDLLLSRDMICTI